ncbi:MAG: hypothetical protein AAF317_08665 [Pseudomonadota bacterium]
MPNIPTSPYGHLPWRAVIGGGMMGLAGGAFVAVTYPRAAMLAAIVLAVAAFAYLISRMARRPATTRTISTSPFVSYDTKSKAAVPGPAGSGRTAGTADSHTVRGKDVFAYDPARFNKRRGSDATEQKLLALRDHPETPKAERLAADKSLLRRRGRKSRKV